MHRLSLVLVALTGVLLFCVATVGLWGGPIAEEAEGTVLFAVIHQLAEIRWAVQGFLMDRYPELGRVIRYGYSKGSPIDWHLGAVSLLCICGLYRVSAALASVSFLALRPLLVRKFVITITNSQVRVRSGGVRLTLDRDDNGPSPIRFRVVTPEEYFSRYSRERIQGRPFFRPIVDLPPGIVEMTVGTTGRHKLLFCRRVDRAEAIASQCQQAMHKTNPVLQIMNGA